MNTFQPDFERFRVAVTRERLPDRVPSAEVEVDVPIMEAYLGRPVHNVADHVEFWKQAGYDFTIVQVRGQPLPDHPFQQIIGQPDPNAAVGAESHSTFAVKGISDWESFEKYPWRGPKDIYYGDTDKVRDCLPDGMKLVMSHGPLFSGMWRCMGLETFSIACVEQPDLIRAISEKMGDITLSIIENLCQRDWVGAIWFGDDFAYTKGLMVSPAFMREYVFPYYKKIGDICRRYHKPYIFHSDGDITEVTEDLIACGIQSIHPNEPTSVDIVERKRRYGDRLSFIGNIDVGLLTVGTPEDVVREVRALIDNVGPGGGFALGSGNSVASYCKMENYLAMLAAVREYGAIY